MKKIIILFFYIIFMFNYRDVVAKTIASDKNYIIFNDELWRIIDIDSNQNIKLMRNNSIGKYKKDDKEHNNWSKSSLKNYLNLNYYYGIDYKYRKLIKKHKWITNNFYNKNWYGKIGLISIEEYDMAYLNNNCENLEYAKDNIEDIKKCINSNYLNNILNTKEGSWTISEEKFYSYYISDTYFPSISTSLRKDVFPCIYLKGNITLEGNGSINNPYTIK